MKRGSPGSAPDGGLIEWKLRIYGPFSIMGHIQKGLGTGLTYRAREPE